LQWVVVSLSVGAAFAFSVSTTLKNASAGKVPLASADSPSGTRLWRFARDSLQHPLWLAGAVADVVGLALQVTALHLGALALVQPLLVTGLLFALALRHLQVRHIELRELCWAAVLTLCLIGLLTFSGSLSSSQHPSTADRLPAFIAALAGRPPMPERGRAQDAGSCSKFSGR